MIGDLRRPSGDLEHTDMGKADILNSFFAGIFTKESLSDMPALSAREVSIEVCDVDITPGKIEAKLSKLNPCSSPGPDGIHPCVLLETRHVICTPLAVLFRKMLELGVVPHDWKLGRVVPIFKKGDKKDPGNYRPVNLTSVLCKVLESLIRDRLLDHLIDHHLLSDNQHGFRPKRSCSTQLFRDPERVECSLGWPRAT